MSDKTCEHCCDYTKKVMAYSNFQKNEHAMLSIYEHYLEVIDDRKDGNIISFKIKYCPMCGRNLGDGK